VSGNVIRFSDYEKKSREPDSEGPRNPADADVIVLPVIHTGSNSIIDQQRELFAKSLDL
jgi:hypothetical protein